MHPLPQYAADHDITTYGQLLVDPGFVHHPKFQKMLPTHLLWSRRLEPQLQRAFALGAPMASAGDSRVVDGPDLPVKRRGWLARRAGACEYTEVRRLLESSWGITTRDQLLDSVEGLAQFEDEQSLTFAIFRPVLAELVGHPLGERAAAVGRLMARAVEHGTRAGLPAAGARELFTTLTEPWLEEESVLALPGELPTSLVAWNARRLSVLAWAGTRTGLVSVAEVGEPLRAAIAAVQRDYSDWREFHDAHHLARRYWIGSTAANWDNQVVGVWMLQHGESPWVQLPLKDQSWTG